VERAEVLIDAGLLEFVRVGLVSIEAWRPEDPVETTVCTSSSWFTHVTVSPTGTVTVGRLNLCFMIEILGLAGLAAAATTTPAVVSALSWCCPAAAHTGVASTANIAMPAAAGFHPEHTRLD
jgi:hypothetical protein